MKVGNILITFLFTTNLWAINCVDHPLYCQIKRNKPEIDSKYAMRLSNSISKYSHKYGIEARLYSAILAQESGYRMDAMNCVEGLNDALEPIRACQDYSLAQISYKTAQAFKIDLKRIMVDLDYAVESGVIILKNKIKTCLFLGKDAWTCYHSKTESYRTIYKGLVLRYY